MSRKELYLVIPLGLMVGAIISLTLYNVGIIKTAKPIQNASELGFVTLPTPGPATSAEKTNAGKLFAEGVKTNDQNTLEQADKAFTDLLKKDPSDDNVLNIVVYLKSRLSKFDDAAQTLQTLIRDNPSREGIFSLHLGSVYDQKGDREQARKYLRRAADLIPDDPRAYFYLSRLAVGDMNYEEIRSNAQKVIDLAKDNKIRSRGYAMLAESYHYGGDSTKGLEAALQSVALDPEYPGGHHIVGETLLEEHKGYKTTYRRETLPRALKAIEKAKELGPGLSHNYVNLGTAYWLNNEKEKAIAAWKDGLDVLPKDTQYPNWYKVTIENELKESLAHPEKITF